MAEPAQVDESEQVQDLWGPASNLVDRVTKVLDELRNWRYPSSQYSNARELWYKLRLAGVDLHLMNGWPNVENVMYSARCTVHTCMAVDEWDAPCGNPSVGFAMGLYMGTVHQLTWFAKRERWVRFCDQHADAMFYAPGGMQTAHENWREDCQWKEAKVALDKP